MDIFYEGLFYARRTGAPSAFTLQHIPDTTLGDYRPNLVLDVVNHPSVAWFQGPAGPAGRDMSATWFATRAGGSWTAVGYCHLSNFSGDVTLAINGHGQSGR